MRFHLQDGFPLVTSKYTHFKSVAHELLWFLKGETNTQYLKENGVTIWDEWADENGDLGPIYGRQWRNWNGNIDQISEAIRLIREDPTSRRIIVSAWNPTDIPEMALAPCHCFFQFYVQDGELSCQVYQRSADVFLGVPFNIASYALLTHLVAAQCGLKVGQLVWTGGDVHLYQNHLEQAKELQDRPSHPLPELVLTRNPESIFEYQYDDLKLVGYKHSGLLSAPVAV